MNMSDAIRSGAKLRPQLGTQAPKVGPTKLATDASAEPLADPGGDRLPTPALPLGAPPAANAATNSSCCATVKSGVLGRDWCRRSLTPLGHARYSAERCDRSKRRKSR